ncbi:MAG: hypothetical protein IJW88_09765, partial [Alistipes sp.]|nr:hypothetical protein [Alistipes sp.]
MHDIETGSIISVTDNDNKTTTYTYDSANQLTRENDQAANTTTVWTYDSGGNILTKNQYAYTTGTPGTPAETNTYGYTDASWGDLLKQYNGVTINYDGIGNPINDGTWRYTWEHGRQLAAMYNGTASWSFDYDS